MEEQEKKEQGQTPPPSGAGTATVGAARPSGSPQEPAKRSDVLPDDAPEAVRQAADGEAEKVKVGGEKTALDWLLGATRPVEYDVPVKFDTPEGPKELVFHIRQLDGKTIIDTEDEHRKGTGPFAELDDIAFNADLVAKATLHFTDPSGRKIDPRSAEFLGENPFGPAIAMEARFRFQPGLLDGVAGEIRKVSGYAPDRVGAAERSTDRVLGEALGG